MGAPCELAAAYCISTKSGPDQYDTQKQNECHSRDDEDEFDSFNDPVGDGPVTIVSL